MNILQTSQHFAQHSAELAEKDPHGIIVTIVSVTVVLLSLFILFLAYLFIGKIVQKCEKKPERTSSGKKSQTGKRHQRYEPKSNLITIRRSGKNESLVLSKKTVDMARGILYVYGSSSDISLEPEAVTTSGNMGEGSATVTPSATMKAPLPGIITSVNVNVGDKVRIGQEVAVLEAMKMENSLECEMEGTVTAVHVTKGEAVLEGSDIITIG